MAAILLLPGYGGKYTSETFTENSTTAADTIDCSRCAQLLFQVVSTGASLGGNYDIEQTTDGGTSWGVLSADASVTTKAVVRLDVTDGPFGVIRINPTDITGASSTVVVTIVGWEMQTAS